MIFDKYWKEAKKEANRKRAEDKKKEALLNENMNYAYFEEIIQRINENPNLRVKITLKDGTVLECNTKPKKNLEYLDFDEQNFLEVK